jgi:hypothetical protein
MYVDMSLKQIFKMFCSGLHIFGNSVLLVFFEWRAEEILIVDQVFNRTRKHVRRTEIS